MLEHEELIEELDKLRDMSVVERLEHGRRRRHDQIRVSLAFPTCLPRQRKKCLVGFHTETILFEAVSRNDLNEVQVILRDRKSKKNIKNQDGLTLVHQACIERSLEMLRMLVLQFGCDLNLPDNEMWTPLHTVALCGYPELATFLLANGANALSLNLDSNMPYDICDDDLTLNIIEQHMADNGVTQHLIESLRQEPERRLLSRLLDNRQSQTPSAADKHTPLHTAATHGYMRVVSYLVASGENIHAIDSESWQPIHCAAYWKKLAVIELLVLNGASLTSTTDAGETALDLCNDDQIRQWMLELERSRESRLAPPPHINQHKTSSQTTGRYDSSMSLSEINSLNSTKRGNSLTRDERMKQSTHDEFISSLLSVDCTIPPSATSRKNFQVPVINTTTQSRPTLKLLDILNQSKHKEVADKSRVSFNHSSLPRQRNNHSALPRQRNKRPTTEEQQKSKNNLLMTGQFTTPDSNNCRLRNQIDVTMETMENGGSCKQRTETVDSKKMSGGCCIIS